MYDCVAIARVNLSLLIWLLLLSMGATIGWPVAAVSRPPLLLAAAVATAAACGR